MPAAQSHASRLVFAVLLGELLALALLRLGFRVESSLVAGAALLALIAVGPVVFDAMRLRLPRVLRGAGRRARGLVGLRWFRFRLVHMLVLTTLLAVLLGWDAYRRAYVARETGRIAGRWVMVDHEGRPLELNGEPIVVDFNLGEFRVDPRATPRHIDFISARGSDHGIYAWEGDRLKVMHASGWSRPASFEDTTEDLKSIPGGAGKAGSITTYQLRRPAESR
ncbi:hypothetical protein Mal64_39090 [Pseudobythopirellula maris]|uniref:Uncharacterized protein n=1 Tax=Pseudobythopirellula maris TaxID=2527991 RepID=A0A5C5ZFD7_9BACT|nr:hypothetical protein [Pseudobythopirellula maris]TWT86169.1 hypothetical protein Mal64_39090 [Pseudobythopirellula maris]